MTRSILDMDGCRLRKGHKTGVWILVSPYTVNETYIGVQECSEAVFLRYGTKHMDLPQNCYSCGNWLSISYTLYRKKEGPIPSYSKIYEEGLQTFPESLSRPHTCGATPLYKQVVLCKLVGTHWTVHPNPKTNQQQHWNLSIRETSLSNTSGIKGRTVLLTCLS